MDKQKTGNIIREARIKKEITQQELGELIGVSNKAVSRWENGESFPDVGILEDLANALELTIEEIVLGETCLNEACSIETCPKSREELAQELVRTARLQNRERERGLWCLIADIPILLWLIMIGALTQSGTTSLSPTYIFVLPTIFIIGILLWETIQRTEEQESSTGTTRQSDKLPTILTILSGLYSFFLMYGTLTVAAAGKLPSFLPLSKVGSFINTQLVMIYMANVIYIGFCFLQRMKRDVKMPQAVYSSIAVAHLQLYYSSSLHNMDTLENYAAGLLLYSFIFALIAVIMVFVHNTFSKRQNM